MSASGTAPRARPRATLRAALALALLASIPACSSDSPSDADDTEATLLVLLNATGLIGGAELDLTHEGGLSVVAVTPPSPAGAGATCATNVELTRVRSSCAFQEATTASQVRWSVRVRVDGSVADPRELVEVDCDAVDADGVPVAASCTVS